MGSNTVPDGWELTLGTWGTDIDRSDTDSYYTGNAGFVFKDSAVGATIASPPAILPYCNDNLTFTASVYVKSLSGNGKLIAAAIVFDASDDTVQDATFITSLTGINISSLPKATQDDAWHVASVEVMVTYGTISNSSYVRVYIGSDATADGAEFLVDSVLVTINPNYLQVKYDAVTLTNDNAWHALTHAGSPDYHKEMRTVGDEFIYMPVAGTYSITGNLWDSTGELGGTTKHMDIRLGVSQLAMNGGAASNTRYYYGVSASSATEYAHVNAIVNTSGPSRIWLEAKTDASANITIDNETTAGSTSYYNSHLQAVRVGR